MFSIIKYSQHPYGAQEDGNKLLYWNVMVIFAK